MKMRAQQKPAAPEATCARYGKISWDLPPELSCRFSQGDRTISNWENRRGYQGLMNAIVTIQFESSEKLRWKSTKHPPGFGEEVHGRNQRRQKPKGRCYSGAGWVVSGKRREKAERPALLPAAALRGF